MEAAKKIQRCFKLQHAVYRHYGAELFCMWDGSHAHHGLLSFATSLADVKPKEARFLAFSDTTSCAYLGHFLMRQWKLAHPEVRARRPSLTHTKARPFL